MYVFVLFVNGIVTGTGQDDQCIYIWLLRGALPYRVFSSFLRYLISISWHFKVIIGKRFHPFISNRFENWWKSRSKISTGAVGKTFKLTTPDSASGMIFKFCLEMMCRKRCLKFSLFPRICFKILFDQQFLILGWFWTWPELRNFIWLRQRQSTIFHYDSEKQNNKFTFLGLADFSCCNSFTSFQAKVLKL